MDIKEYMADKNEKPLDRIVSDGGFTSIFRTIGCIGDSLSSGEFSVPNKEGQMRYYDMFEYSWGQFIARMTGSKVYNFSRGGMTAKEFCDSYGNAHGYFAEETACQCYIVALGVNDVSRCLRGEDKIGSVSDIDFENPENSADTFMGYYGKLILRYKKISPDAKFFLMTAPQDEDMDKARADLYDEHRRLLFELAEKLGNTYVIDLRTYAPNYNAAFKEQFFLFGHMNPAGYAITAKMVASYIDYIIRNNMNDFMHVGFIGKHLL